jgi:hypothetical protein
MLAHPATPKHALSAPRAMTVLLVKTGDRGKIGNRAKTANLGPTPIWGACASVIRARAVPPLAASLIRCAPASTPCAAATAAKAARVVQAATGEAAREATAAMGVWPIRCAPTSAAYADTKTTSSLRPPSVA